MRRKAEYNSLLILLFALHSTTSLISSRVPEKSCQPLPRLNLTFLTSVHPGIPVSLSLSSHSFLFPLVLTAALLSWIPPRKMSWQNPRQRALTPRLALN